MLHLWPESTTQKARNILNQTVYALKRDLAAAELFLPGTTLAFNPAVITSDQWNFERALARRDLDGAANEYGGEFLSHFTMGDAPEFERWMEGERNRLAQRYFQAVVTLAERAEERGDHSRAAEWWWTLIAQEPLSAIAARGLIASLAARGERTAALTYAKSYKDLLAAELGIEMDQGVRRLVEHLEGTSGPGVPLVTEPQLHRFMDDLSGSERFASLGEGESRKEARRPVATASTSPHAPISDSEDFYRRIVESAADIVYTTDLNGCFTYTNSAGAKLLGLTQEQVQGRPFVEFVRDDFRYSMVEFYARQINDRIPVTYYEFPVGLVHGATCWLAQHVQLLWTGSKVTGTMAVARDITMRKRLDRSQHQLAVRDGATKLLNAAAFRLLLEYQTVISERSGQGFLLLFVSVDNAEDVLSELGPVAVDSLIEAVGQVLAATLRRSDAIARLSVNQIAVLAIEFKGPGVAALDQRIRAGLKEKLAGLPGDAARAVRISATFYDPRVPVTTDALLTAPVEGEAGALQDQPLSPRH